MIHQKQGRSPGRPKAADNNKPTKETILLAAIRLFLRDGFQKVSVDDIAKEAGMTKASVYYYFGTKADLFKEAMVTLMNRVRERILLLLASDASLYERLLAVAVAHLQSTATIDLDSFMRESKASLTEEQILEMKLAEEHMYTSIEEAFSEAMTKGDIPAVNAKFAAHSYISLLRVGNYRQQDGTAIFSTAEEAAENILEVFWRGFFGETKL